MAARGAGAAAGDASDRVAVQRVGCAVGRQDGWIPPGMGRSRLVDGRNVTIDYRWADGQLDRMAAMAADLIGRKVTVILAGGNTP